MNHDVKGCEFNEGSRKVYFNFAFDCDSEGVIYLISCAKCGKNCVGSTITAFRKRFNNHKSSMNRYGKGHRGIENILVTIVLLIRRTLMNQHKERDFGPIS